MARGYSANRSMSNRPTLKAKRQRSTSVAKEEASGRSKTPVVRAPPRRVVRAAGTVPSSVKLSTAEDANQAVEAEVPKQRTPSRGLPEDPTKRMRSLSKNVYAAQRLAKKLIDEEDAGGSEPEDETTKRQDVVAKYKAAGHLVDEVLSDVIAKCLPDANTSTLCKLGDSEMQKKVKAAFAKTKTDAGKGLPRGMSYPCSVSVNNVLCNHAPITEAEGVTLKEGDVVKVHLGCHIDGYPVSAARTVIVQSISTEVNSDNNSGAVPETVSSAMNAIEASRVGLDSMIHILRPGVENADVTDYLARVGGHYDVEAVEGVLSTRTKRWITDSMQSIICRRVTKSEPQQDVAPCTIEAFQVWNLDVAYTNAPAYKMQLGDDQVNIYRKNELSVAQDLRSTAASEFLAEIKSSFHCFPFHSSHSTQPVKARLGISILKKAGLLDTFSVLQCKGKQGFVTARFSATVIVSDKRVNVVCGAPPSAEQMHYPVAPTPMAPDVAALLNEPLAFAARDATGVAKPAKRARVEKVAVAEAD